MGSAVGDKATIYNEIFSCEYDCSFRQKQVLDISLVSMLLTILATMH